MFKRKKTGGRVAKTKARPKPAGRKGLAPVEQVRATARLPTPDNIRTAVFAAECFKRLVLAEMGVDIYAQSPEGQIEVEYDYVRPLFIRIRDTFFTQSRGVAEQSDKKGAATADDEL